MHGSVYLSGLKQALDRFYTNGRYAKQGKWSIGKGGYDLDWQLSYEWEPVIDCIDGKLENVCLSGPMFRKVSEIIIDVFPDVIVESKCISEGVTMNIPVVKSGTVMVKQPFSVKNFNDDDGWVTTKINPGTYAYQVLDFRGWKPRQLKVGDEWVDVMGNCKELEELLSQTTEGIDNIGVMTPDDVEETTTVSSIAPTVDYLGHVTNPMVDLPGMDAVYPDEREKDDKPKAPENFDWKPILGRLVAGESVREVIGSLVKESMEDVEKNYEIFKKISTLSDIIKYPGDLVIKTAYPYKDTFGMRIEDPDISAFYGGDIRRNIPPYVVVEFKANTSKPGWENELEKLSSSYYTFDDFRNKLEGTLANPFISDVTVKVGGLR